MPPDANGVKQVEALLNRLGPAETLRILKQFEPGRGDYTRERDSWLQDASIDALAESIERRRHSS